MFVKSEYFFPQLPVEPDSTNGCERFDLQFGYPCGMMKQIRGGMLRLGMLLWMPSLLKKRYGDDCMEKISSFTIDHLKLQPGLYVSRKDKVGDETVTTFDLRLTKPNEEPVMNTAEVHTIEHLAATYLRNEPNWKDKVLYFGPMGCRTGFYLLLTGDYTSKEVVPLVLECFRFIQDYRGDVPGASAKDCGNYLDMNLPMANYWGGKYAALLETIDETRLKYPE